jgi:hypothetical protein
MNEQKATCDSWKTIPMPGKKKRLQVNRTFSEEEYQHLQIGHIPRDDH